MKKNKIHFSGFFRVALLWAGILLLSVTAAIPAGNDQPEDDSGGESSQTKQGPIRLTVINKNEFDITLRLDGPAYYILSVPSGEQKVFVIDDRGDYPYSLYHCKRTKEGILQLYTIQTFTIPPCMRRKLVKINIENKADTDLTVRMFGPQRFILTVPQGETKSFTIPRGRYFYRYRACSSPSRWSGFTAKVNHTLSLSCP
ncbi:MAG: hypothetical protein ACE5GO_01430 [Anaerolineales bacterium]